MAFARGLDVEEDGVVLLLQSPNALVGTRRQRRLDTGRRLGVFVLPRRGARGRRDSVQRFIAAERRKRDTEREDDSKERRKLRGGVAHDQCPPYIRRSLPRRFE